MAVIIGITMLVLSREVPVIQGFLNQANQVIIHVVGLVCRLLPLYIFASLASLIGKNGIGILKSVWKPFLFCVIMLHFMLFAKIIITAIKLKARPAVLIRKILPTYLIGLTTASSMAAFGSLMDINEKKLGIPAELSRMGFPIGSVLNTYAACIGFVAVIFYLAELHGVSVNIGWFISIFICVTIISCAMPPVPGGMLIGIGIILNEFGLPASDLALAGTILMFCDFFMTSVRIGVLHLELALQADHWGKLDKDKLRSAV
jgi:Na+/H+-dicarboxylate symporter